MEVTARLTRAYDEHAVILSPVREATFNCLLNFQLSNCPPSKLNLPHLDSTHECQRKRLVTSEGQYKKTGFQRNSNLA